MNEATRVHAEWLSAHPKCVQALSDAVDGSLVAFDVGSGTLSALKKRRLVFVVQQLGHKRTYQPTALGKEVWAAYLGTARP